MIYGSVKGVMVCLSLSLFLFSVRVHPFAELKFRPRDPPRLMGPLQPIRALEPSQAPGCLAGMTLSETYGGDGVVSTRMLPG